MSDMFVGAMATAAVFFVMVCVYGAGRTSVADECRAIGVFSHAGSVYDCKPRPEVK